MTVKVTKPAINVREKLSELDKETGIKGEELLRADTSAEAREALQLDQQLFTDFESTGIDDNATSTAVTIDSAGNVGIGETNPDGLLHLTGDTNANGAELYLQVNNNNTTDNLGAIHFGNFGDSTLSKILSGTSGANNSSYLTFSTSNSGSQAEAMRIDSSGNVGIGNTNPVGYSSRLVVDGGRLTMASGNRIGFWEPANLGRFEINSPSYHALAFYTADGTTEVMRITSTGNVGIGTSSPVTKLDVVSASGSTYASIRRNSQSAGEVGLSLYGGTSGINWSLYQPTSSNDIRFYGNGADRLTINSAGNVGIGTSTPTEALTVVNGTNTTVAQFGGTSGGADPRGLTISTFSSAGGNDCGVDFNAAVNNTGYGAFTFSAGPNERMHINSIGNVNIGRGATHPDVTARLAVFNSGASESYTIRPGTNVSNQIDILSYNYGTGTYLPVRDVASSWIWFSGSAGERARIDTSGNLLVGRTSTITFSTNTTNGIVLSPSRIDISAASLCRISQLRDSTGIYDRFYNGASIVGSITGTTSATAYNTSSDQRLKENIADANDAGSKVDAIQVRQFDWKVDGSHQDYGMVAQELMTVAPEAVTQPEDSEEMMAVDYSKLVPMLIKEIQSLRNRVATLEGN